MDNASFLNEFDALSKLLGTGPQDDERHDAACTVQSAAPASIGPKELLDVKVPKPQGRAVEKDIWADDEAGDAAAVDDDIDDGREMPSYEFIYKQAVQTTDAYLGMSGKDPSSTCCEELLVRIQLPGARSAAELDLDVKPQVLRLTSAAYRLCLALPHKVDDQGGSAKWDADKKVLNVCLPIIRDDELL